MSRYRQVIADIAFILFVFWLAFLLLPEITELRFSKTCRIVLVEGEGHVNRDM